MYSFILINQSLIFKHHLAFLLFFKLIFNGRIIDLQCCVGFCHTMMWISHKYTYVSPLLNLPPRTYPIPSFCIVTEYQIELPVLYSNFALPMVIYMFQCYSLNSFYPLLPLLCPEVCSLCLCLYSCPANTFISTIFLDSLSLYTLIYNIFFPLSDLLHSV